MCPLWTSGRSIFKSNEPAILSSIWQTAAWASEKFALWSSSKRELSLKSWNSPAATGWLLE